MEGIMNFWKCCFNIKGTATRKEFWIGYLVNVVGIPFVITLILSTKFVTTEFIMDITKLIMIVLTVPLLTSIIRRLRDAGRKWYWIFLYTLVPLRLVLLVLLLGKSKKNGNDKQEYRDASGKGKDAEISGYIR